MGPVATVAPEAQLLDLPTQLGVPEYAHVATRNPVVVFAQGPAHPFRPAPRHRGAQQATGAQHAADFGQRRPVVGDVFQYLGTDYPVEAVVGEGQAQGSGRRQAETSLGVPRLFPVAEFLAGGEQLVEVEIDAHGVHRRLGIAKNHVASLAAAQIQQAVPGA